MHHTKPPNDEVTDRRSALIQYASKITGDRDHAEDVVQEAYLRLRETQAKRLPAALIHQVRCGG